MHAFIYNKRQPRSQGLSSSLPLERERREGLSSLAQGEGKRIGPGNEVGAAGVFK